MRRWVAQRVLPHIPELGPAFEPNGATQKYVENRQAARGKPNETAIMQHEFCT